jgi:hypothetical protein
MEHRLRNRPVPDRWCDRLGAACGLLHRRGDGPASAVVTFHAWATPALGETDDV